jgi:hypothetical protein
MPQGALEIEGSAQFPTAASTPPALSELSRQILTALVDDYDVFLADGGQPAFRLRKQRPGA